MATWTAPVIHNTADVLAVTDYNGVANNTTFLYQKPYGLYYPSSGTNLTTGSPTQVALTTTLASGYGFSLSSNNAVLPLAGVYQVMGQVGLSTATTGFPISAFIYHNGNQVTGGNTLGSYNTSCVIVGSANDTVGLGGYQQTGGTVTTGSGSNIVYLHIFYVGSQ